ncbi:3-oxo-tetronate kinase [Aliagarivorans marinus]|uniref:3-oxo-tetronate kinase n=1 Tax=Aliagarivorans marinus TaxID=561965 RepID=UPI00040C25C4|nr:3-oxo-tetronate kinase [Aliagarivorans marinus]
MKIGVIADDFTGATDAASFIVKNGLSAVQFSGVQPDSGYVEADALVVSLKTRSCAPEQAVAQSLAACDWLLSQGCTLIYFKYCSTFDSTAAGNIGPVSEALMERLVVDCCLICPALPVNGRTVYQGHLFVFDALLSESGMRNHPITPMTDANLLRLIEQQSSGQAQLLDWPTVQAGREAIAERLEACRAAGSTFVVCDSLTEQDLLAIAEQAKRLRLVTGGSGLVGAIAASVERQQPSLKRTDGGGVQSQLPRRGVILSGSCSVMTNQQVAAYKPLAAHHKVDIGRTLSDPDYLEELTGWVLGHADARCFPMVYATVAADELSEIQQRYGEQASAAVEQLFHDLVKQLHEFGFNTFISAGGETSGTITQALDVERFSVGQEIAPGVPWMYSLDGKLQLALKSGNFGSEQFFQYAQEQLG